MSAIAEFYKNKTIFLTGGTGFIGKLLIDQLLRKTEPRKLYLLIREKKGESADVRVEKLFQDVAFNSLKAKKSKFFEKIEIIPGDLSKDNLGLSDRYIDKIHEEVDLIIHGAASVSLDDSFESVANVNIKGSIYLLTLCHQIKKLKAFAFISTAYSFCPYREINEELYDIHITCDEFLHLVKSLSKDELKAKSREILGKWPNPYTLGKALVEDHVKNQANGLPVAIVRPSIIMGTCNEPIPGWTDNYYGPNGVAAGAMSGLIKVVNINGEKIADIVPGDMVAACVLAAAYKTASSRFYKINPIFNIVPFTESRPTWEEFSTILMTYLQVNWWQRLLRQNYLKLIANSYLYEFLSFFFHFIPTIFIHLMYKLQNRESRMIQRYRKCRLFLASISYFGCQTWYFSNDNTMKLWNELNDEDKKLFNFNTKSIVWQRYLTNCFKGIRKYLFR